MSKPLVSDELWAVVEPLLPPEPPKPKGGRPACAGPRCPDRHPLRAQERHPLGDAAAGAGLRLRRDLLAPPARLAGGRRLGPAAPGPARPARARPTGSTGAGPPWTRPASRPKGGRATGPNPTDRGKPGTQAPRGGRPPRASRWPSLPDRRQPPRHASSSRSCSTPIPPIKRPSRAAPQAARRSCTPTRRTTSRAAARPCARRHITARIAREGIDAQRAAGPAPLGGRAHPGVAQLASAA